MVFHQKLHFLLVPMVVHPDPQLHIYELPGYVKNLLPRLLPIFFVLRRMSDTVWCRNGEGWVEDFAGDGDNCKVLPKEEGGRELQG